MPSINLGGLVSGDSRSRLSGVTSGLDSDKIISATIEAKMAPVKKMEDQVKFSNEKIGALTKLKTYFQDLKSATDNLRAAPGYSSAQASNVLSAKKVVLSSDTIANPVNYLDISAANNVDSQIFSVKVDSIAKSKIQQTTAFASTSASATEIAGIHTNGKFTAGTFQINSTDITLVAGDSLANIAAKINAVSGATKVSATIIQPSIGQYRIQLKALETGIANAYSITDNTTVLNDVLTQVDTNVQTAANAQIKINNNITVARSTNTITDYIDGLTVKVYNPTTDNITVDIDYDKKAATDSMLNFVEKYNNFISYSNEQQAQDSEGNYLESAKIRRNAFLTNSREGIVQQLGSTINNNAGFEYLEKIGIKFPSATSSIANPNLMNSLEVDAAVLTDAVYNNFGNLRKLLEFQYSSTSQNFTVTKRSNNIGDNTTFSVNVDVNRAAAERAKITYGATTIDATFTPNDPLDLTKGGFISGPAGTPFEGFEFQYAGAGANETTDMVASQGIMDKMYNVLENLLKKSYSDSSGSSNNLDAIDVEISSITDEVKATNSRIEMKKSRIEKEKEALIEKYAVLEASVAKSNSILQMLDAQQRAMDNR